MAQGQAYKQMLLSQIDRVRDLAKNVEQKAASSTQRRIRELEKQSQEQFLFITKQLLELKERPNSKTFNFDKATIKDLGTRIGGAVMEHAMGSFHNQLLTKPDSDGRISGRPLQPLACDHQLTKIKV